MGGVRSYMEILHLLGDFTFVSREPSAVSKAQMFPLRLFTYQLSMFLFNHFVVGGMYLLRYHGLQPVVNHIRSLQDQKVKFQFPSYLHVIEYKLYFTGVALERTQAPC